MHQSMGWSTGWLSAPGQELGQAEATVEASSIVAADDHDIGGFQACQHKKRHWELFSPFSDHYECSKGDKRENIAALNEFLVLTEAIKEVIAIIMYFYF